MGMGGRWVSRCGGAAIVLIYLGGLLLSQKYTRRRRTIKAWWINEEASQI